MKKFDLNVEVRTAGKSHSRESRMNKKIPAIVYGSTENKNVLIDENTLVKFNTRAYENALYNLKSSDSKLNGVVVLVKDVQIHPVSRRPQHADLFALDLTKPVRVFIEIRFDGKPIGLAEGGLMNVVNRQIEVECLPTEIPEGISMDISEMSVGDTKHVSDLKLPAKIRLLSSPETTLVVVSLFVEEEASTTVAAEGAAPAAAGAAAPAAGKDAKAPAAPAAAGGKDAKAPAAAGGKDAKAPAKK